MRLVRMAELSDHISLFILFGKFQIHVEMLVVILQRDQETEDPGPGERQGRQEVGSLGQPDIHIDQLEQQLRVGDGLLDDVDHKLGDGCQVEDDQDGGDEAGGHLAAAPPLA